MTDPALYVKSNPFQKRDANEILEEYKSKIDTDDSDMVLDIGCGTGDVTSTVLARSLERFKLLLGIDRSADMINFANKYHRDNNIRYEVLDISGDADVRFFKENWGAFNKIFSFYCLHWIKNLETALSNIHYLMQHGGQCLLVFVAKCPVFTMYERMATTAKWEQYMRDANEYVPDTHNMELPSFVFSDMMENAGITTVECDTVNKSYAFSSTKDLREAVVAINPFIKRIPVSERDEYLEDCIKTLGEIRLETGPVDVNENYCFSYELLVAYGTRN